MWLIAALAALVALNYWMFFSPRRRRRASDVHRVIEDPVLGVLALDETTGELEVNLDLGGMSIPCAIGPIDTVEGAAALASVIAGRLPARDRAARAFAARDLLQEANDLRAPNAPLVTAEQFAARLRLTGIRANISGGMRFFYEADGLFGDRGICVTVDQARGALDVRIGD